jgi:hypothetical protein
MAHATLGVAPEGDREPASVTTKASKITNVRFGTPSPRPDSLLLNAWMRIVEKEQVRQVNLTTASRKTLRPMHRCATRIGEHRCVRSLAPRPAPQGPVRTQRTVRMLVGILLKKEMPP